MYLYLALSLLPIVMGGLIKNKESDKHKKMYLCFVFGALAFFTCFRGSSVGTDTGEYLHTFQLVKVYGQSGLGRSIEYGFLFVVTFFSKLFSSGQSIIIFFSGITYAVVAYAIYKHSEDVVMSSFLFVVWVLPSTMNGMRQHFAFALILLAFINMDKGRHLRAAIIVLLAILFHTSAIIFLLFFFVSMVMKKWPGFKGTAIVCVAVIIAILLLDRAIQLIANLVPRYAHYLKVSYFDEVDSANIIWIAIYSVFLVCCLILIKNKTKKNELRIPYDTTIVYYMCLMVLHIVVLVLAATEREIFLRLMVYTSYGSVFVIPYVMRNFFTHSSIRLNKRDKGIVIALFYMLFIVWDYLMLRQNPHHIIPYALSFFN